MRNALLVSGLLLLAGCAHSSRRHHAPRPPATPSTGPVLELGESWPLETNLDHADIPDAPDVWLQMVRGAQESIDFAEFYAADEKGSRLRDVIDAVETAVARGVKVRFLAEAGYAKKYPDVLNRLQKNGVDVRRFEVGKLMGGILHAKYFIVDGREAWMGSQNFDWRSLVHIQELGARMRDPSMVRALVDLYQADWEVAGGSSESRYSECEWPRFPVKVGDWSVSLKASPKGFLCGEDTWDLPLLLKWIDEAKDTVKVQLLTYKPKMRDGTGWTDLDLALRRAAGRGVKVYLLVSSWNEKEDSLRSLAGVPNVKVGILTIPQFSGGDIPFARVVHAKFMTVDSQRAWVGTSNWEGDYFLRSRNVSLFVEGASFAAKVEAIFDGDVTSGYMAPVKRN